MARRLFLSDEPIEDLTEDAFGYKAFVETLYKCVKDCDSKINIGLFGKWGVGKTSIINLLIKKLETDDQKIKPFLFDAWKYSRGDLPQELVLGLNAQFRILNQDKLEREIYGIQEKEAPPTEEGLRRTLQRVWGRCKVLVISALVLFLVLLLLDYFNWIPITIRTYLFLLLVIPIALHALKEASSAAGVTEKVKVLPTKFDPGRLQRQFKQTADGIVKKNKADKLVIIIDNIDRCSSEAAIEMLETIKTLMEHDKCVYLLPCDDSALIKHLVFFRKYEQKDAREFLRKFFQTSFTIPPLLSQDLEEFAGKLLSSLKIPYNQEVLQVMVSAFMENPRRIKQFLNNLTTQYLAAHEREQAGILKQGSVTSSSGFLAKILVIRQEYPSFYEKLESKEDLLELAETYFRGRGGPPVYKKYDWVDKKTVEVSIFDDNPRLEQFLKSTMPITVEDISPFLKLNRETYPSTIPDEKEFRLQINDGNVDYALSSLDKLKQEPERAEYIRQVVRLIDSESQAGNYVWVFNGVDILTKIYEQSPAAIKPGIAAKIGYYLTLAEIRASLKKFDYSKIFPILRDVNESYRSDILSKYSAFLLEEVKLDQDIIDHFIELYDLLPSVAIGNLSQKLIAAYADIGVKENAITTIRKLNQNPEVSERLISGNLVTAIEESIDTSVTEENKERISLYLELRGRSGIQTKLSFLKKAVSIIQTSKNNTYDEAKRLGLQSLMKLDPNDVPSGGVEELHNALGEFTSLMARPNDKLEFVKAFFRFFVIFSQPQREQFLKAHIVPLINSGDAPILTNILDKAKEYNVRILSYDFVLDGFSDRVRNNLPNVELIKSITLNTPKKNKEQIKEALVALISNPQPPYHNAGLESFKQLHVEFTDTQISEICDACLDRSKNVAMPDRRKFIEPIFQVFGRCLVRFKSKFADYTSEFLSDTNTEIRSLGIECFTKIEKFIDKDKKAEIIIRLRRTIEESARRNEINEGSKPIIDLIVSNQAVLGENDTVSFIDILIGLLSEAKGKEPRLIGLEYLGQMREFYYRRGLVLNAVKEELASGDEDIRQQAGKTLELLKASSRESAKTSPEETNSSKLEKNTHR